MKERQREPKESGDEERTYLVSESKHNDGENGSGENFLSEALDCPPDRDVGYGDE